MNILLLCIAKQDLPDEATQLHSAGAKDMKRWCSSSLDKDVTQALACVDAMQPHQILIVEDQPGGSVSGDWITQLKQQAETRQILCSSVGPRA